MATITSSVTVKWRHRKPQEIMPTIMNLQILSLRIGYINLKTLSDMRVKGILQNYTHILWANKRKRE